MQPPAPFAATGALPAAQPPAPFTFEALADLPAEDPMRRVEQLPYTAPPPEEDHVAEDDGAVLSRRRGAKSRAGALAASLSIPMGANEGIQ